MKRLYFKVLNYVATHHSGGKMGCHDQTSHSWAVKGGHGKWRVCEGKNMSGILTWLTEPPTTHSKLQRQQLLLFFEEELEIKKGWWKNCSVGAKRTTREQLAAVSERKAAIGCKEAEARRGLPKLIRSRWFLWRSPSSSCVSSLEVPLGILRKTHRGPKF